MLIMRTNSDVVADASKTLLYALHGWGKTTQAANYKRRFGRGLVISGESGLRSLMHEDIEFVPFHSWDSAHDPMNGQYSFRGICREISGGWLKKEGYNWIMIDSLTELSDQLMAHLEANPDLWTTKKGQPNPIEMWGLYGTMMIGAMKWIRDLPVHVLVTALAKESQDDNAASEYWPAIKGSAAQKQIPGIFDFVFGGVRTTSGDKTAPKVDRYVVTDEVRGWKGKARDPRRRLKPVELCGDITELLARVEMPDSEYEKHMSAVRSATKEN